MPNLNQCLPLLQESNLFYYLFKYIFCSFTQVLTSLFDFANFYLSKLHEYVPKMHKVPVHIDFRCAKSELRKL